MVGVGIQEPLCTELSNVLSLPLPFFKLPIGKKGEKLMDENVKMGEMKVEIHVMNENDRQGEEKL